MSAVLDVFLRSLLGIPLGLHLRQHNDTKIAKVEAAPNGYTVDSLIGAKSRVTPREKIFHKGKRHMKDRSTSYKHIAKVLAHIKLSKVIISLPSLLVKNADRQAEVMGHGRKLSPRAHQCIDDHALQILHHKYIFKGIL